MRPLLIIGAGGFGRETAEAVRAVNAVRPTWDLLGFLDDDAELHGTTVGGVPVLGLPSVVHDHPAAQVVITTGRPDSYFSRREIAQRLGLAAERYATVIHPTASVGSTCQVGAGSVLLAQVALTADVVVGRHVAMMPHVALPHDARVDDFATLATGVRVGGGCRVGENAYIGAGACFGQNVVVGAMAMVGMGSVVTRDVPTKRLWFGVPARDVAAVVLPIMQGLGL